MTARSQLLEALGRLYSALTAVRERAEAEGDAWAGIAARMVEVAVAEAAERAEVERRLRDEHGRPR